MTDYIEPITKLSEINDDECLFGYRAGLGFIAVDYSQRSASYWHGYQNGQSDRGFAPANPASQAIAREMVGEWRRNGMN